MDRGRAAIRALTVLTFVAGCSGIATIQPEFDLPPQDLRYEAPQGHAAVVFFNASSIFLFGPDGSGKLNVFVSEKPLASLRIGEYVQVVLPHGEHFVTLAHLDVGTFTSAHALEVEGQRMFVEVYARISSNGMEVVELPKGFEGKYDPALDR